MAEKLSNEAAVDRALASLARREGDVMVRESTSTTIEVKDGALDTVISRGERALGVRVLVEGRVGVASTSDLSAVGIGACVDAAVAMCRVVVPDVDISLAREPIEPIDLGIDLGETAPPIAERAKAALAVEDSARSRDARIKSFRKTTLGDGVTETILATTTGVRGSYREAAYGLSTSALANENGDKQIGGYSQQTRRWTELDPQLVGRRAAERAVAKLGARPFSTRRIPVLFDPWMGMALLGAVGQLFSAEAVLKGKSLFAGKIGKSVASRLVTIVDDARMPGGMRSAPFDGEGTRTRRVELVAGGTLGAYLTDRRAAKRMEIPSTGNARRGPGGPPRIGTSNYFLVAGDADPASLARDAGAVLRVTSLLNLHTINATSGEFSLGATGELLQAGERLHPVEGITIAGNLTSLLGGIVGVGSDLTFSGGHGSPTFLVGDLSVGGK